MKLKDNFKTKCYSLSNIQILSGHTLIRMIEETDRGLFMGGTEILHLPLSRFLLILNIKIRKL
ncbi:MAG: hypothetical protein EDM75_07585 [Chlorobiota bacterium]|nr:MAG: hypothetical protein EDM75_07585 [Chlorobiota bacterium]